MLYHWRRLWVPRRGVHFLRQWLLCPLGHLKGRVCFGRGALAERGLAPRPWEPGLRKPGPQRALWSDHVHADGRTVCR